MFSMWGGDATVPLLIFVYGTVTEPEDNNNTVDVFAFLINSCYYY